jgi:Carboxypeptidase regulatory-like domain
MQRFASGALALCALFGIFMLPAAAQTAGSVSGKVVSATGAPIANATVELENTSTGARQQTTTDSDGNYQFDHVASGTYRMTTSTAQYAGTPSTDIVVDATRPKTVNVTMQTGASTAPTTAALVTVQNPTTAQDLTTPQLQTAFNTRDLQYLPTPSFMSKSGKLYGSYNLSLTDAGVASNSGIGPGVGPVVGGQRPYSNDFLIEGEDNNTHLTPGPLVYTPNESISEFVLSQNQFPPTYGHSSGGQFNQIANTGTNQVHGELYDYLQNRNLDAIDQAYVREGLTDNPRYDQNRLGGDLGLPLLSNKLYFFGGMEYIPLGVANAPVSPAYGPTAAGYSMLAGMGAVNQTNLGVLQQYLPAAPNATTFTTVNGAQIPIGVVPITGRSYQNQYDGIGSIDWKLGNSDDLRARFTEDDIRANSFGSQLPGFFTPVTDFNMLANVSEYHNLGAEGINELRLGYTRSQQTLHNQNLTYPGMSSFPNLISVPSLNLQLGEGITGFGNAGLNTYQLADNINWVKGHHTIQFGVDARRYIGPLNYAALGYGTAVYSGLEPFLLNENPDIFGSQSFGNLTYSGNHYDTYAYVDDNWRVASNFNINLGVRYEYVSIPQTLQLQGFNSIASVPGVLTFNTPNTQKTNFAPIVGIAFSPTSMRSTLFRAGFGMDYDAMAWSNALPSVPPGQTYTQFANTFNPYFGFFGPGGFFDTVPVNVFVPSVTAEQAQAMTTTYVPDQQLPYTMQWNAGIEQNLTSHFVLHIGYLGVKSVHLPAQTVLNSISPVTAAQNLPLYYSMPSQAQLNALPTTLSGLEQASTNPLASSGFTSPIFAVEPSGSSWYNGLLVEGTQRFTGGLQFKAAYTWSHLMDNISPYNLATGMLGVDSFQSDWHDSIYDHRQRGTLTALWDPGAIGANQPNWFRDVVANLTISGIYTYETPSPIPLTSGFDAGLAGGFFPSGVIVNPSGVAGTGSGVTALTNSAGETVAYLATNPNAQFIRAGAGNYVAGTAILPGLRPINNFDAAVFKRFAVRDRFAFEIHAEAFNVLNHPQYIPGSPDTIGTSGLAGQALSGLVPGYIGFGDVTQMFSSNPRTLQVGLRLLF